MDNNSLTAQNNRKAFLLALSDLQSGKQAEFQLITAHLQHYQLYPYLIYADLATHLSEKNPLVLQNFLNTYADTPLAGHLRSLWLYQLAKQQNWQYFLQIYASTNDTHKDIRLNCYQKEALWKTGKYTLALNGFFSLLNKNPLPTACLWVLHQALNTGNVAEHLIWEKIQSAFEQDNLSLAVQLAYFLPEKQKNIFAQWKAVYQQPFMIKNIAELPENFRNLIVFTAIKKIANQNIQVAIDVFRKIQESNRFILDFNTQIKILRIIALNLAQKHDLRAPAWLAVIPEKYIDKTVSEWRIRSALWQQNWSKVKEAILLLPPEEQKTTQWRYWLARALAHDNQTVVARNIYHDLSLKGDFYGQLADVQLNQQPLRSLENLKISPQQIEAMASLPSMQRAHELYQLHWLPEANQEFQWTLRRLPEEDYLAVTALAIHWGWFDRAISTVNLMSGLSSLSNIALRFPLAYREPIIVTAQKNNLNPAWLFALIRQESLFTPYIKSSAGAIGLMQLLPETANIVANQLHIAHFSTEKLIDATTNLGLGSYYLKKMLMQFKDCIILATAAYNAGPNRVKKWLPPAEVGMPADIWIENIPYKETRQYVMNIMMSMTFYEKELNLPITLAERMSHL